MLEFHEPMKLLLVSRRYPPDVLSGTETVFENLYKQAKKHHEVRLVAGYRVAREKVPEEAVAVDLRGKGASSYLHLCKAAVAEARRFKPDVVLGNSIEVFVPGVPTAVIVHDLNFGGMERGPKTLARELFYRLRSKELGAIITVSHASKERLVQAGILEEKIEIIHNGVDLERFKPMLRPPDGMVHFAYPSRIVPGKGQHVAIDALGRLRPDQKKNLKLTLVGALVDQIYLDRLRLESFQQPVEIHTDVPDIAPYYQQADVIVFPTLMEEGFGFTAVEGMACVKPVIWSDQPAIREATGGIGIGIPMDDAAALKEAMWRLMQNPEERKRLGEEGRAFVEKHYRWENVWAHYETVMAKLA
jgi:glycosyltransferase involved in cell wall biosynthesis